MTTHPLTMSILESTECRWPITVSEKLERRTYPGSKYGWLQQSDERDDQDEFVGVPASSLVSGGHTGHPESLRLLQPPLGFDVNEVSRPFQRNGISKV